MCSSELASHAHAAGLLGCHSRLHAYMAPSIPATSDQLAPLGLLTVLLSVTVLQMLCILPEGSLT